MKPVIPLIVLLLLFFSAQAGAEYYMYFDKNGIAHFTNEYYNIPKDLRDSAREYIEYEYKGNNAVKDFAETKPTEPGDGTDEAVSSQKVLVDNNFPDAEDEWKRLTQQKNELDQEYNTITKKVTEIDEAKNSIKSKKEVEETNRRIQELNQEIEAYENRRESMNKEAEAYNAKLKQHMVEEKTPPPPAQSSAGAQPTAQESTSQTEAVNLPPSEENT